MNKSILLLLVGLMLLAIAVSAVPPTATVSTSNSYVKGTTRVTCDIGGLDGSLNKTNIEIIQKAKIDKAGCMIVSIGACGYF